MQWDIVKEKEIIIGEVTNIEKYHCLVANTIGLHGNLQVYDCYLRGLCNCNLPYLRPKYTRIRNGEETHTLYLPKKHGQNALGALGYIFYFYDKVLGIAPEVGFAYQYLGLTVDTTETAYTPFIGVKIKWQMMSRLNFFCIFDYHLGIRDSVHSGTTIIPLKIQNRFYMGPEATVRFDCRLAKYLSLGVNCRFKYLISDKKPFQIYDSEQQKWATMQATVRLSGFF